MTIAEILLPKLSDWEPAGVSRHEWSQELADTGWTLHLSADHVDTLGCKVWEILLTRANAAGVSNAELKKQAIRAADRATCLMEPLHFLELDETRGEALLRSEAPSRRGTALAYYEVLMTGGRQILVRRYQVNPDKSIRREQVAFALTHEAIAKLVGDLVDG